uniref:CKLF-like MARVEL transmembrane domain containing 7 n=1 Tax=Scleropages formosus TaxID=113540 RepID=A0A8C9TCY8_SCLFO
MEDSVLLEERPPYARSAGIALRNSRKLNVPSAISAPCLQVALLIAFLCVHCSSWWTDFSAFRYFQVVTLWFLVTFLIFLFMHIFRLQSKMPCINWALTEFLHYAVGMLLIFIASLVAAVKSRGIFALIAGSVFGFIATVLLAISVCRSYRVACGSQPTSERRVRSPPAFCLDPRCCVCSGRNCNQTAFLLHWRFNLVAAETG